MGFWLGFFGAGLGLIRITVKFKIRKKQIMICGLLQIVNYKTPTDHFKTSTLGQTYSVTVSTSGK